MSENKNILATSQIKVNKSNTIHDDYVITVDNLASYCLELSKTKKKELGNFYIYEVFSNENPYRVYLEGFEDIEDRSHYICHTCHHFLKVFGNAVYINKDGSLQSAIWNPDVAVGKMIPIVKALKENVESSNIKRIISLDENISNDVFRLNDDEIVIGKPTNGGYKHLYAKIYQPKGTYKHLDINLYHEYTHLYELIDDFSKENVNTAFKIASSSLLGNARNSAAKFKILLNIFTDVLDTPNFYKKENKIYKYACEYHDILSTFFGSVDHEFLKDIHNGLSVDECVARYNYKIDPIRYKRPTAAPTESLVRNAEKIIADLGLENSLKRRLAKLSDIPKDVIIWSKKEKVDENKSMGVFGNVITKEKLKWKNENPILDLRRPKQRITFNLFKRNVLPNAESIKVILPTKNLGRYKEELYPFAQYTTESIAGSAPIAKYDSTDPNKRNPFICYAYHNGATKSMFNLGPDELVEVEAIIPCIELMYDDSTNLSELNKNIMFILKGCKDVLLKGGLALFPDVLRPELYPIRKVIESYSNEGTLEAIPDNEQALAGIILPNNYELWVEVKTTSNTLESFTIDRLE